MAKQEEASNLKSSTVSEDERKGEAKGTDTKKPAVATTDSKSNDSIDKGASASSSKKEKETIKIVPAIPIPEPEPDPNVPSDRDVCVGCEDSHNGTMLFFDLIRIHYVLWKKKQQQQDLTKDEQRSILNDGKEVEKLASRLIKLVLEGKKYELSGLKDVPKPFLKGQGRFFKKVQSEQEWKQLDEDEAKSYVMKCIAEQFETIADEKQNSEVKECVDILYSKPHSKEQNEPHSAPRPCDVLFLPVEYPWEENMAYEHQSGNKHLLYLASQHVSGDTTDSDKRVAAAFKLITSQVEVSDGTNLVQKNPRFVIQLVQEDSQNTWDEMNVEDLSEFAAVFVFEVFLEKQMHGTDNAIVGASISAQMAKTMANLVADTAQPSETPIEAPTTHDVLFGRGGMTNGHPGNRRFRDVIALHRPDYIKASKMDKPNVARRIVRAIRQGNPPGRFLKKSDDGMWRDVGDKIAAEKTSQGLRERSNAEKRQRSAMREALRIRREDMAEEHEDGEPSSKKAKTATGGNVSILDGVRDGKLDYDGVIPRSLGMNDKSTKGHSKKGKKGPASNEKESAAETLPPNAVDKDGNILVTDYDILCGRGGLTNHHKGNKRFRDIVALHRPDYVRAPKVQKPSVARVIVRAIRNGDPPGRFLKKDEKTGKWIDIGDKKAAEKTSQALREKMSEEKSEGTGVPAGFTSPTLLLPTATVESNLNNTEEKNEEKPKEEQQASEDKAESNEKRITTDGAVEV